MPNHQVNTIILGSGFGGTLLSMMLASRGQSVAVVDHARHPRFAIGESSTPLADQLLAQIADEYDLPVLHPLSSYGTWKASHPNLTCGPKLGFSYFGHANDPCHESRSAQPRQMLVAARSSLTTSDTHWLRSDVDAFLCEQARKVCRVFEGASYRVSQSADSWVVEGHADEQSFCVQGDFIVDATGRKSVLASMLNLTDETQRLQTKSGCEFAHFSGVELNSSLLSDIDSHPFDADQAAVHHVLHDGWMWQLRFDDGTTSVGFCKDVCSERSLHEVMQSNDFLRRQFASARLVRPVTGVQSIQRLQFLRGQAAGATWAALPSATGFVDPLHSTGIAHTLFRLRKLASLLTSNDSDRAQALDVYSNQLVAEILHIDRMIEGCYAALPSFRLWCLWCMVYFAAITSTEAGRSSSAFLLADDRAFSEMLRQARSLLHSATSEGDSRAADDFEQALKVLIAPWNGVGLLEAPDRMYSSTAVAEQ